MGVVERKKEREREMAEENKVILHGMWGSPFSKRVELALKLKGIQFEYIEEDLVNKSELLLQYNPVHKEVPVLVHHGKPIAESFVILEYIDQVWADNAPKLLPLDHYQRAKVRFWASFIQQLLVHNISKVIRCDGDVQKNAIKEVSEKLTMLEENMEDIFPGGIPSFSDNNLGLLDVIISTSLSIHKAIEEATGVKIIDPERTPLICSWITALTEIPVVKDTMVPHAKMVTLLQFVRQKTLQSSVA